MNHALMVDRVHIPRTASTIHVDVLMDFLEITAKVI